MESSFHLIILFPVCFCLFVTLLKEMEKILALRRCWKWLSAPFNLLEQQSKEEYEYVKKLEAKKAAAIVASSTPVTTGTTISTTTTQLPAKQEH